LNLYVWHGISTQHKNAMTNFASIFKHHIMSTANMATDSKCKPVLDTY